MRRRRTSMIIGLLLACAWPAGLAAAEPTPSPSPTPSAASPTPTPTPTPTPAPTPTPEPTPSETPSATPTTTPTPAPTETPTPAPRQQARSTPAISLAVDAGGTPQAGRFFEDLGWYAFSGVVDDGDGAAVAVQQWGSDGTWHTVATATPDDAGRWSARRNVTSKGDQRFRATTAGATSPEVDVTVRDSYVSLATPKAKINALSTPKLKGAVAPARAGVTVVLQVKSGKAYHEKARTRTAADGSYTFSFSTGKGELKGYRVRTYYRVANRDRNEISPSRPITRIAVLYAVVAKTTAADVAKTYRSGCPVGPSKLRTITMNYYGFDKRMHRGVIIVRTDLVDEIRRAFQAGLDARYPIRKMNNPNVYGGNDPTQMAADNTSGFNCRKVVGNPYAQSPHSYGIAIDVNTVENPYRDANGKWWPKNGKPYIDRTPLKRGMLGLHSRLTAQLRHDHYFWGGLWSPGRDYQHFQYDR